MYTVQLRPSGRNAKNRLTLKLFAALVSRSRGVVTVIIWGVQDKKVGGGAKIQLAYILAM